MTPEIITKKQSKPVYLSVPRLMEVIRIVSERSIVDVNAAYFQRYGFGDSDSALAVSSLRFLGLVDDDGHSTISMNKISSKSEDSRKKAFEEVVKTAYSKLFELDKPYDLSPERLHDEIRAQYDVSTRIATSAVPAFLKLCELAGLREGTPTPSGRTRKQKTAKDSTPHRTATQLNETAIRAGFKPIRVAEGRMVLNIPSELQDKILEGDDEKLHDDWRNLRLELKKFADNYIPEDSPDQKNATESNSGEADES